MFLRTIGKIVLVARTLVDRALADQLRAACIAVALDLGGWNKKSQSKIGKSKSSQPRRPTASQLH
jgi:hypothetical protein